MSALELTATVVERGFDVRLEVAEGETLALLGANGAGKSTLLAAVAGLLRPDEADISLGGRALTRTGRGRPTWVPPHGRNVGLLAQEPRLFPHLDALANVAFGPRSRGVGKGEAQSLARDWLARVDLTPYADRRPRQLSGGQAQRVAVARALAAEPALVMLDEPLAALDVDVTPALRGTLREVLAGRTAIIATHDVLDAILLADRIAVLDGGRLVEHGPTREVLARPRSAFAAAIAGLNMVSGSWEDGAVVAPTGRTVLGRHPDPQPPRGTPVVAVFRPASVAIYRKALPGSPRNSLEVTVATLEPHGELVRVRGDGLHADVTPSAAADLDLAPGARVHFVVKAAEVDVYRAH
jgi:molybdate transport system ATP-binding protein